MSKPIKLLPIILLSIALFTGAFFLARKMFLSDLTRQKNAQTDRNTVPIVLENNNSVKGLDNRMMTNGEKESFEWWYLDGNLDDGTKISISFHPPRGTGQARIIVGIAWPNGDNYKKIVFVDNKEFNASKETCNVKIGRNTTEGNLDDYSLHLDLDDLKADVKLHRTAPMLNTVTRCTEDGNNFCSNWLPLVPRGNISGKIIFNGKEKNISGLGYYEHSWGNMSPGRFADYVDRSNWGRAWFDNYTVIFFATFFPDNQSHKDSSLFYIIKDNDILVQDKQYGELLLSDKFVHPDTEKTIYNHLTVNYNKNNTKATFTLHRKEDLLAYSSNMDTEENSLLEPERKKYFGSAYQRFTGAGTFKISIDGREENFESEPIWEQFDF